MLGVLSPLHRLLPAIASCWHCVRSPFPAAPKVGAHSPNCKGVLRAGIASTPSARLHCQLLSWLLTQISGARKPYTALMLQQKADPLCEKSVFAVCQICFSCPKRWRVYPHILQYAQSTYFPYHHASDRSAENINCSDSIYLWILLLCILGEVITISFVSVF